MSVMQIIDDWHYGRVHGLSDLVTSRMQLLRDAEGELRKLVQERNCPERNCSLQRPGQRSLDAILKDIASGRLSIACWDKRAQRAIKWRDSKRARRQFVNRIVHSFVTY